MRRKTSLKDIAQKVGVSTATVSYVLSKDKESKVSEGVAARIKQAATELNYQPNQIAKSLKVGRTNTLGLIVADISNPFFANIARVVEDEAKEKGYTVIFGSSDEKTERSCSLVNVLLNRQVDGFMIVPTEGSEEQIHYLQKQNVPFVLIDRYFPDIPTSFVAINNYKAAYDATAHLIKAGKKRIGMIAYDTSLFHMQERQRGYREALLDYSIPFDNKLLKVVKHIDIKEGVKGAIEDMFTSSGSIDALFFAANALAINGLKYIDSLNLKVPVDLAVVSFDEGEAFDFYYCPLTFVRQPIAELAKKAVEVLVDRLTGSGSGLNQVLLEPELVIRKSCGAVPAV